ncbi:sulfite exporter TauE/SafE family protein [Desulfovibrio legallii]|uniref:Probable membrane transporter protein n=1 Tax=Desulfovibrio legallii TaxID=571438 RepID=A0A1G7PQK9_9BACT|nr:sulfite exporter TauE/SafE family protein [Desulfovibrio legallii]SDF88546.1 hypothetical protein SAMN05192586_1172 [Desulfovibrio legallii]
MAMIAAMLALGLLLGFVGAGGAGLMITVMTVGFDVPVHTALGTALASMVFTTLSGSVSHFREGNVRRRLGLALGLCGALGAFAGARVSATVPPAALTPITAAVMLLSALLIYLRVFHPDLPLLHHRCNLGRGARFWGLTACTGVGNGFLSGACGVGATPFIQLTLLIVFDVPLYQTVGTTMLVILPIAALGSLGFLSTGHLDPLLLAQVLAGQTVGAYIGAKGTRLAPPWLLKGAMVTLPALGGAILLLAR